MKTNFVLCTRTVLIDFKRFLNFEEEEYSFWYEVLHIFKNHSLKNRAWRGTIPDLYTRSLQCEKMWFFTYTMKYAKYLRRLKYAKYDILVISGSHTLSSHVIFGIFSKKLQYLSDKLCRTYLVNFDYYSYLKYFTLNLFQKLLI